MLLSNGPLLYGTMGFLLAGCFYTLWRNIKLSVIQCSSTHKSVVKGNVSFFFLNDLFQWVCYMKTLMHKFGFVPHESQLQKILGNLIKYLSSKGGKTSHHLSILCQSKSLQNQLQFGAGRGQFVLIAFVLSLVLKARPVRQIFCWKDSVLCFRNRSKKVA